MQDTNSNFIESPSRFLEDPDLLKQDPALKIAKSSQFINSQDDDNLLWPGDPSLTRSFPNFECKIEDTPKKRRRIPGFSFTPDKVKKTKNVVRNYGNAIAAFAISPLSVPYLKEKVSSEKVSVQEFQNFFSKRKESITNILNFRGLLQEYQEDDEFLRSCKRIFRYIAEVFLKYFSVNWIFEGKMMYKLDHLKYRGKLLRRIKHPELFTYLKGR